jgi:hypothetical protein
MRESVCVSWRHLSIIVKLNRVHKHIVSPGVALSVIQRVRPAAIRFHPYFDMVADKQRIAAVLFICPN